MCVIKVCKRGDTVGNYFQGVLRKLGKSVLDISLAWSACVQSEVVKLSNLDNSVSARFRPRK